jgi:hypothetical protein
MEGVAGMDKVEKIERTAVLVTTVVVVVVSVLAMEEMLVVGIADCAMSRTIKTRAAQIPTSVPVVARPRVLPDCIGFGTPLGCWMALHY